MSTVLSVIQEWTLLLRIGFIIAGLVLAFGGRFIHDAFILLLGWLVGAGTGFWVASAIVSGLHITGSSKFAAIGVSTLVLGAIGARWLWSWYVFIITFTGMVLSYIGLTIVLRLAPHSTAVEGVGAMFISLLAAGALFLGVVPGLLGLLSIFVFTPLIINHKALIHRWQNLSIIKEEITEGGVSISIRILAVVGFFAGYF